MSFSVEIASVSDRDEIVAEIWKNDEMVAELQRTMRGDLVLEIYANAQGESWRFDFKEWLSALNVAREKLEMV